MQDVSVDTSPIQLVFHDDDDTPQAFVTELLRSVFGKSDRDATTITSLIETQGKAACGPYPPAVANVLFETAQQRIDSAGHRLLVTSEIADTSAPQRPDFKYACAVLDWHFAGISRTELVTTAREFPGHMRADVQAAVEQLFTAPIHFSGIHEEHRYETLTFAGLMRDGRYAQALAPPQYHDVEVGEIAPAKCLHNGLWLCQAGELFYAALLSFHREFNNEATIRIEIAAPTGAAGAAFMQRTFSELEQAVRAARSYRGKVLSFDGGSDYRGRSRGVMVHKLPPIGREGVILPDRTLRLLDRNVLGFVESRAALRRLGQSTRKGILLYGPPGTGKTHTIRYLATNLPDHTTLIITAEQVALLGAYMNLARLLQPTMVVIEDVDLIARDREEMGSCEEPLLNKLLNEMDGLKEDSDILFVLTTNRPEQLESALAGRPGRVDQAIEVPRPDETGRGKLVQLYGKGLSLAPAIVDDIVRRTDGVSAAFIKELMRRLAQGSLARDGGNTVITADLDEALDDMLFAGGRLNVKLLGGAQQMAQG